MAHPFSFLSVASTSEGNFFGPLLKNEEIMEPILVIDNNQVEDWDMKLRKDGK